MKSKHLVTTNPHHKHTYLLFFSLLSSSLLSLIRRLILKQKHSYEHILSLSLSLSVWGIERLVFHSILWQIQLKHFTAFFAFHFMKHLLFSRTLFFFSNNNTALALLKAPDAHLSANTSGYDTSIEDALSSQTGVASGGTIVPPLGPIRIRNLEDILKRLQHHLQHHQREGGDQQQIQQQLHHQQQQEQQQLEQQLLHHLSGGGRESPSLNPRQSMSPHRRSSDHQVLHQSHHSLHRLGSQESSAAGLDRLQERSNTSASGIMVMERRNSTGGGMNALGVGIPELVAAARSSAPNASSTSNKNNNTSGPSSAIVSGPGPSHLFWSVSTRIKGTLNESSLHHSNAESSSTDLFFHIHIKS